MDNIFYIKKKQEEVLPILADIKKTLDEIIFRRIRYSIFAELCLIYDYYLYSGSEIARTKDEVLNNNYRIFESCVTYLEIVNVKIKKTSYVGVVVNCQHKNFSDVIYSKLTAAGFSPINNKGTGDVVIRHHILTELEKSIPFEDNLLVYRLLLLKPDYVSIGPGFSRDIEEMSFQEFDRISNLTLKIFNDYKHSDEALDHTKAQAKALDVATKVVKMHPLDIDKILKEIK